MRKNTELNEKAKAKLGGVADLYRLMEDFFSALDNGGAYSFTFSIPDNAFMSGSKGFSVDYMEPVQPVVHILHDVLTAFICIMTAVACYHKLRKLFDT